MLGRGQPLPSSAQHFSTGHWTQTTQKRGEAKFCNLDSSKTAVKWVFAKLLAAGISPWEICLQGLGLSGVCLRFGILAELSVLLHGSVSWALLCAVLGESRGGDRMERGAGLAELRWGSKGGRSRGGDPMHFTSPSQHFVISGVSKSLSSVEQPFDSVHQLILNIKLINITC